MRLILLIFCILMILIIILNYPLKIKGVFYVDVLKLSGFFVMKVLMIRLVCEKLNIPFIGIRVISNNELTGNSDIEKQFEIAQTKLQLFIFKFLTELTDNSK